MIISIIAAIADNLVIGNNNKLLWHLPADFSRLRRLTMNKPIIMGRNTFESIGKPLPGRENIVITSRHDFKENGITVANSLDEALAFTNNAREVFIFGGATVYKAALPLASRMYLTLIKHNFTGDVFFPQWSEDEWCVVKSECHASDVTNQYDYEFVSLDRRY